MSKNNFISISELAKKLNLINKKNGKPSTHTIRFWESQFNQLKPTILRGNRRYYSNKDVEKISLIKFLLKDQGLTISGAKKVLNTNINNLDDYNSSSIKATYFKKQIKIKSKELLKKIKGMRK
jgi:DNA-binding transcriptional MerR regulator